MPAVLLVLGLCALLVGMAKPHATVTVPRHDATVVLAIDVSRSMEAKDVPPSRLFAAVAAGQPVPERDPAAVQRRARRVRQQRDRLACRRPRDRDLVRQELAQLRPGEGTAIGDAVLALGAPRQEAEGTRTASCRRPPMLVISDGARDGGRVAPLTAAKRRRRSACPVSTVLVGTPDGVVTAKLTGGYTEQIRVPAEPDHAAADRADERRHVLPRAHVRGARRPSTRSSPRGSATRPRTGRSPTSSRAAALVLLLVGSGLSFSGSGGSMP